LIIEIFSNGRLAPPQSPSSFRGLSPTKNWRASFFLVDQRGVPQLPFRLSALALAGGRFFFLGSSPFAFSMARVEGVLTPSPPSLHCLYLSWREKYPLTPFLSCRGSLFFSFFLPSSQLRELSCMPWCRFILSSLSPPTGVHIGVAQITSPPL